MASISQTQVQASQPSPYPGMSMLEWSRLNAVSQQYYLNRLSSQQASGTTTGTTTGTTPVGSGGFAPTQTATNPLPQYFTNEQWSSYDPNAQAYAIDQANKGNVDNLALLRQEGGTVQTASQGITSGGTTGGSLAGSTGGTGGAGGIALPGGSLGGLSGSYSISGATGAAGSTAFGDPNISPAQTTKENVALTTSPEVSQYQSAIQQQQQLYTQQQQQLAALQQQYQGMVTQYQSRDAELTQYLTGLGESERQSIEQRRAQLKASAKQDLLSRGITSTSALDAVMRGIDTTADQSLGQFEENLRRQKLDYRATFSGDTLAAQEQALQFSAGATGTNFAAGQQNVDSMQALAEMMSQQRLAGFQTQAELRKAAISSSNNALSSILGYKADMARIGLGEKELASQEKLGYAGLQQRTQESALGSATSTNIARINQPKPSRVTYGGLYGMQ